MDPSIGSVVQWVKSYFAASAFHIGMPVWPFLYPLTTLLIQRLAVLPEKAAEDGLSTGIPIIHMADPTEFKLLASALSSPSHCGYLRNESVNGKSLSISLIVNKINIVKKSKTLIYISNSQEVVSLDPQEGLINRIRLNIRPFSYCYQYLKWK